MRLLPGYLHVGIVLIAQTRTATLVVGRFKIEVTTAAATVKLDTGANVNGEGEIPGQRLRKDSSSTGPLPSYCLPSASVKTCVFNIDPESVFD